MKALSLSQPWCWSIFDPIADKDIENRSWPPPFAMVGKRIAIHAAKSWDDKCVYKIMGDTVTPIGFFQRLGITHAPVRYDLYAASMIVGVATIGRVVTDVGTLSDRQSRWFFGEFGWVLTDRRKLQNPILCGGKQGLWTVDPIIEALIEGQLGETN